MKSLPADVTQWLNTPPIEPLFLIEIELGETLTLSTRQQYEYGGVVYESGKVQGLTIDQEDVSFGLINTDYQYTTPALRGEYHRELVRVWWAEGYPQRPLLIQEGYVADGYYVTEPRSGPVLIFEGNISAFDQIDEVLGVIATRSAARHYPAMRVLPPIANFVAPSRTVIAWGDYTIRLDPRDD